MPLGPPGAQDGCRPPAARVGRVTRRDVGEPGRPARAPRPPTAGPPGRPRQPPAVDGPPRPLERPRPPVVVGVRQRCDPDDNGPLVVRLTGRVPAPDGPVARRQPPGVEGRPRAGHQGCPPGREVAGPAEVEVGREVTSPRETVVPRRPPALAPVVLVGADAEVAGDDRRPARRPLRRKRPDLDGHAETGDEVGRRGDEVRDVGEDGPLEAAAGPVVVPGDTPVEGGPRPVARLPGCGSPGGVPGGGRLLPRLLGRPEGPHDPG